MCSFLFRNNFRDESAHELLRDENAHGTVKTFVCALTFLTVFANLSWCINGSQGWNQKKPLDIVTLEFGCSMID